MIRVEEILLGRMVLIVLGLITLLFIVLALNALRQKKELVKARIFLHYDSLHRMLMLVLIVAFLIILAQVGMIALSSKFEQLAEIEELTREECIKQATSAAYFTGIYRVAVFVGLIYVTFILYRAVRMRESMPEEKK